MDLLCKHDARPCVLLSMGVQAIVVPLCSLCLFSMSASSVVYRSRRQASGRQTIFNTSTRTRVLQLQPSTAEALLPQVELYSIVTASRSAWVILSLRNRTLFRHYILMASFVPSHRTLDRLVNWICEVGISPSRSLDKVFMGSWHGMPSLLLNGKLQRIGYKGNTPVILTYRR